MIHLRRLCNPGIRRKRKTCSHIAVSSRRRTQNNRGTCQFLCIQTTIHKHKLGTKKSPIKYTTKYVYVLFTCCIDVHMILLFASISFTYCLHFYCDSIFNSGLMLYIGVGYRHRCSRYIIRLTPKTHNQFFGLVCANLHFVPKIGSV